MDIEKAFHTVHRNLQLMPQPYCKWKSVGTDGIVNIKSVGGYRTFFNFIPDLVLRNNLAELRFVLDYYHSVYALLGPGLTFAWHHQLIMLQTIAAICEGLLFDACNKAFELHDHADILWRDKKSTPSVGLGYLLHKAGQLELYNEADSTWLNHLKFARNTIHPRSLNDEKARWNHNPVIQTPISITIEKLDAFIETNRLLKID